MPNVCEARIHWTTVKHQLKIACAINIRIVGAVDVNPYHIFFPDAQAKRAHSSSLFLHFACVYCRFSIFYSIITLSLFLALLWSLCAATRTLIHSHSYSHTKYGDLCKRSLLSAMPTAVYVDIRSIYVWYSFSHFISFLIWFILLRLFAYTYTDSYKLAYTCLKQKYNSTFPYIRFILSNI